MARVSSIILIVANWVLQKTAQCDWVLMPNKLLMSIDKFVSKCQIGSILLYIHQQG